MSPTVPDSMSPAPAAHDRSNETLTEIIDNDATTSQDIRRRVSECRLHWQRAKKERLLQQHKYCPGQTTRRFSARVSAKFQDNTFISQGGVASYGPNRSRKLADEMADGSTGVMQRFFRHAP